jgi:hypothetical protein
MAQVRVLCGKPPLDMSIEPSFWSTTFLPSQKASAEEESYSYRLHDRGGDYCDAVGEERYRYSQNQAGCRREPCANPELISS